MKPLFSPARDNQPTVYARRDVIDLEPGFLTLTTSTKKWKLYRGTIYWLLGISLCKWVLSDVSSLPKSQQRSQAFFEGLVTNVITGSKPSPAVLEKMLAPAPRHFYHDISTKLVNRHLIDNIKSIIKSSAS
jgi:hypothetical protein